LQELVEKDAATQSVAINSFATEHRKKAEENWTSSGGELITLPADEHASMMKTLASVGAEVSKSKPALAAAYKVVTEAAQRTR